MTTTTAPEVSAPTADTLRDAMPKEGYPDHPIAAAFPMMTGSDFIDLANDIEHVGLREDIVLLDGMVLDGRNRQQACVMRGVTPIFRLFDPSRDGASPTEFVTSQNLRRRQLTPSQAATAAVELLPFFEEEAKQRQRAAGVEVGSKNLPNLQLGALGANLRQACSSGENGTADSHVDTSGEFAQARPRKERAPKSSERAGRTLNVSARAVEQAKSLKQKDPRAFEDVKAGRKSLNAALTGKPSAGSKAAEDYEKALARIEQVCGKQHVTGIRQGAILRQSRDVITYAKMEDEKMLAIRTLLDEGWPLALATNYKAEVLNPTHRIVDIADRAVAARGKYEQNVWIENRGLVIKLSAELLHGKDRQEAVSAAKKAAKWLRLSQITPT